MIHIPAFRVEFTLGRLQITRAAKLAFEESGDWVWSIIFRHMAGDWTELTEAERKQNEDALVNGSPITSKLTTAKGVRLVVRTEEVPRLSTTVMLAQEIQPQRGEP
jgi:hypothetical protein